MPYVDAGPDLWIQFGNVALSGSTDALIIVGRSSILVLHQLFNPKLLPLKTPIMYCM